MRLWSRDLPHRGASRPPPGPSRVRVLIPKGRARPTATRVPGTVDVKAPTYTPSVSELDEVRDQIESLRRLRAEHGFQARHLVPDLAFVGLIDEAIDGAEAAFLLVSSPQPHRAYSMVRVVFEATQRLLVIATAPDYVRLGTRAWLYYQVRDARMRSGEDRELGKSHRQILQIWADHFPESTQIVEEELAVVRKIRKPDNFLGSDLALAVTESYPILFGTEVPKEIAQANRDIFWSLSRETHSSLRLEPSALRINPDGSVEVKRRARDADETIQGVVESLRASLAEALLAVHHRLKMRD